MRSISSLVTPDLFRISSQATVSSALRFELRIQSEGFRFARSQVDSKIFQLRRGGYEVVVHLHHFAIGRVAMLVQFGDLMAQCFSMLVLPACFRVQPVGLVDQGLDALFGFLKPSCQPGEFRLIVLGFELCLGRHVPFAGQLDCQPRIVACIGGAGHIELAPDLGGAQRDGRPDPVFSQLDDPVVDRGRDQHGEQNCDQKAESEDEQEFNHVVDRTFLSNSRACPRIGNRDRMSDKAAPEIPVIKHARSCR